MEIGRGQKFSVIALERATTKLPDTVELAPGLAVAPTAPVEFDGLWPKWLGTIRAEAVAKANLVIVATMDSNNPRLMDAEDQGLETRVWWLFRSLLFVGVPHYDEGLLFHGANIEGIPTIRSVADLDPYLPAYEGKPLWVSATDVGKAYDIYCVLSCVWNNRAKYQRLKRGITAFLKGLSEDEADYRIHQCCRAIEALILPEPQKTTAQFIERSQTFVTARGVSQVLHDIYQLRCHVEHLHGFDSFYLEKTAQEREALFALRARQAEAIARAAYQRILLDPAMIAFFEDEDSIASFWKHTCAQRKKMWGKPTNMEQV